MDIKLLLSGMVESLSFRFLKLPLWVTLLTLALLISAGAGLYVWKDGSYQEIVISELSRAQTPPLNDLWFATDGNIVGVSGYPLRQRVISWNRDGSRRQDWDFSDQLHLEFVRATERYVQRIDDVIVSRDGSLIAALSENLVLLMRTDRLTRTFDIGPGDVAQEPTVSALAFTDLGLLVLGYDNGRIDFLDPAQLPHSPGDNNSGLIRSVDTTLKKPELLYPFGDYLAAVYPSSSSVIVLDLRGTPKTQPQAYPLSPRSYLSIGLSKKGRLAVATGAPRIFISPPQGGDANITLEMWGRIKTLAFYDENRVLVGGDFQDIYTVAEGETPKRVAGAPKSAYLLAVSPDLLAYATPDGLVIASHLTTRVLKTRGKWALVACALVLSLLFYVYVTDLLKRRMQLAALAAAEAIDEDEKDLLLPSELPSDLLDACEASQCVLYGGAGLSALAGFPTWKAFVGDLLEWALGNKFINEVEATSFRAEIETGAADSVADSIVSRLETEEQVAQLQSYLRRVFTRVGPVPEIYDLINSIGFSAVLTTNFDELFERTYGPSAPTFTPRDTEPLLDSLTKRRFFILKLYGTLERRETLMIAPAQYEDAVTGNRDFSRFMETLFSSRTLLFVGASLEGIEAYLRGISLPKNVTRRHYAVVAVAGKAWSSKVDLLERRYGIKVLPFTLKENESQLLDFLRRLADSVERAPDGGAEKIVATSRLKRLTLENIGPFDTLSLEFDPRWNILLGDNGVGKSTVLESIAIALSGEKAQPCAWRLIKSKRPSGTITLESDNKISYVTTLIRGKGDEAEVISTTARPLEAEGWMAIGFPALRTTSWEPPKGPEADRKSRSRPVPEDLMPLVTGEPDPRMDKLKQWIVNLDYEIVKSEAEGQGRGDRHRKLIDKLFEVINRMTAGMTIKYGGVEPKTNRIIVLTEDGSEVPLESVSQGTVSLIGWVGVLLQRLYEVYDQDEDPTGRYALILMDELDAHMHPAWQQALVSRLQDIFPNAQFIATTHSPLVIGGLPARQVRRFAREGSKIVLREIKPDMTIGYSDQVLTSSLFGLSTTLDQFTQDKMTRYNELLGMEHRDEAQEAEYRKLEQELLYRVPPHEGHYEGRHAEAVNQAKLMMEIGKRLEALSADGGSAILKRAEQLLSDIERGRDDD